MTLRPSGLFFFRLALSLSTALISVSTAQAKSGQTYYEEGRFEEALEQFISEQVERPDDAKTMINLGTTLYRLKRYKEAAAAFARAAQTDDPVLKQHALYDLGNSQFREQAFEEAVKSYEQAVSGNPNDIDARENLAVAKAALAQQPQNQDPNGQDPNAKHSDDPNQMENGPSGEPKDSPEAHKENDSSPKSKEPSAEGAKKDESKAQEQEQEQDNQPTKGEKKEEKKEGASQTSKDAKADQSAPTTMSRARAQQLLDKLGETKTVRPQSQKARAPTGGKTW